MAVKKFIKFDSEKGYLDNKDDINYYATTLMSKVAFGKMLGDFDENGLYVINQKIVEELIKMPKVIVEVLEEADLIRSKIKADAFFHFILTIEDNKASFKLLEKIHYQSNRDFNSGVYNNINEYVIDEVEIPDKDFDRNALYQKYNISIDNDGDTLSIFDMDELSLALYYNIVEKLKADYLVQNQLMLKEKELESIEADYFESILGVLGEYGEFGDKVTNAVKKDLVEKHSFVIISKPFFQKTINEILDSYIDFYIQDLSPEQREEVLLKIREIKADYYQKFKALLPIQIAQKAGVRFNANQIVREGIIGGLAKEIETKGFTSSDIRKILINEDELQLSIAKIKEIVKESEEICKRDNAKAKDITKGRDLTSKFYEDLEKQNKVDILKPDTTLIKSEIDKKADTKLAVNAEQAKTGTKAQANNSVARATKSVGGANTRGQQNAKGGGKTQGGTTNKSGGKVTSKDNSTKVLSSSNTKQGGTSVNDNPLFLYGSLAKGSDNSKEGVSQMLADELLGEDRKTVKESTKTTRTESFVHADVSDLAK